MTEHKQTQLRVQNSKRSPRKIRRLTPEELGIPSGEEPDDEGSRWESLQESAEEVATESEVGVAIRTENGTVSTGTRLEQGESRVVHALEFAIWKGFEKEKSSIVDVVVVADDIDHIPCGRCLQTLLDYSSDEGATIQIVNDNEVEEYTLSDLFLY